MTNREMVRHKNIIFFFFAKIVVFILFLNKSGGHGIAADIYLLNHDLFLFIQFLNK